MYLMAFGGAGPVHADAIARALRMRGYIIPASAGVTAALGFLTAPMSFELARSVFGPFSQDRLGEFDAVYLELEDEGRRLLAGAGLGDEMTFVRQADLRHAGQGHEVVLELPFATHEGSDVEQEIAPLFYDAYERVYGHAHRHLSLEIVTCRVTAVGPKPTISIRRDESARGDASAARTASRQAYFFELGGLVDTPTFDRALLHSGAAFAGPAIVEERDSTAVIGPGAHVVVDDLLNLVATFV
jgi:N-methylhydantoinase A/oxoprolinase/acetone carboxylase beta subunit